MTRGGNVMFLESNDKENQAMEQTLEDKRVISEKILELEKEKLRVHSQLEMKQLQIWQNTLEISTEMLSKLSSISSDLNSQLQYLENLDSRLKNLESEVRRITLDIKGLPASVTAIEKNLEQLRNLTERVAEESERLSEDFIDRHVKEPAIKDLGLLYNSIGQVANGNGNGICKGLLKQTRQLMETQGARIIEPEVGDSLDPKEHRPVKNIDTSSKDFDRKIASVFKSGFARNGRVLEHAVVGIFKYKENTNKEKGEHDEATN
jgi:molecular chaperone GrpE (heat shock protein)